jgi:hypothetical protein
MKKNSILLIILIFSLFISTIAATARIKTEKDNRMVDVALDYTEFEKMAEQSEKELSWWFRNMKKLGVTKVALNEETFESMMEEKKPIEIEMAGNIFNNLDWEKSYPQGVVDYLKSKDADEFDVLASTNSIELYKFVKSALENRYSSKKFKVFSENGRYIFILNGTQEDALYVTSIKTKDSKGRNFKEESPLYSSKLIRLGLGLDPKKVDLIRNSGLKVIPRPYNYKSWGGKRYVRSVIKDYKRLGIKPECFIFSGSEVLGYPNAMDEVVSYMNQGIKLGMIETAVQREHIKQDGLEKLATALDYNAVRVFSVWPYIQKKFQSYHYKGAEEIENTLYRAVTERNIRLIYFKPFKKDDYVYVADYKEYQKMFDRFQKRIGKHGMKMGEASVIPPHRVRTLHKIGIGLGVVAGSVLLLSYLFRMNRKIQYSLLGLGIIGIVGMFIILPSWADKIIALDAAVIFPSLGMVYFCKQSKKYLFNEHIKKEKIYNVVCRALRDLCIAIGISFIGALIVGAILSDIRYQLEIDLFKGVKFSQLVPVLIFVIAYLGHFGYKRVVEKDDNFLEWTDVKALLSENIKVFYVMLVGVLLIVGYVYIARTGHESSLQPSQFEMMARNFLEEKLFVRPRTKEFLVAFPALMIGIYAAIKGHRWLIFITGLLAVIGQTSVVNTFCHLRTPMSLSILRIIYSLGLGVVFGIIYIFILQGLIEGIRILRGEKPNA